MCCLLWNSELKQLNFSTHHLSYVLELDRFIYNSNKPLLSQEQKRGVLNKYISWKDTTTTSGWAHVLTKVNSRKIVLQGPQSQKLRKYRLFKLISYSFMVQNFSISYISKIIRLVFNTYEVLLWLDNLSWIFFFQKIVFAE